MSKKHRLGPPPSQRKQHPLESMSDALCGAIGSLPKAPPGSGALVLCARVGTIRDVPPEYRMELTECIMCGHPLWLSIATREAIESKGSKVSAVCFSQCGWRSKQESCPCP